jgi:anhydro-N-acetylmuramic acid kinase
MVYRALGLMSGSSLDGLDLCYAHFQETSAKWSYEIIKADCYAYPPDWVTKLKGATGFTARDYQLLHVEYGHYLGELVNRFLEENGLGYQVQLIGSHGHTTFHMPQHKMTAQLGDGAAIAAETGINVVSDLRAMDLALGGQGAPIVPIGEKILLGDYEFFLNLGGIANLSANMGKTNASRIIAFDVCPANRVLNLLSNELGQEYDDGGRQAASGKIQEGLLQQLNELDYYQLSFPKSLANDFGTEIVYPIIKKAGSSIPDGLRTMTEHIVVQIKNAILKLRSDGGEFGNAGEGKMRMMATGGGALNNFVVKRLSEELKALQIELVIPEENVIKYKEALIMALMGVLRWREENNVMASVTGASRDSIGGAVWIGQEA